MPDRFQVTAEVSAYGLSAMAMEVRERARRLRERRRARGLCIGCGQPAEGTFCPACRETYRIRQARWRKRLHENPYRSAPGEDAASALAVALRDALRELGPEDLPSILVGDLEEARRALGLP